MSTRYSVTQRTPLINSLFAGIACAATLALTADPALAAPGGLERVEVSGRVVDAPVRYDVRANCSSIETSLQNALQTAWIHERLADQVKVQFVVDGGEVISAQARGASRAYERAVRKAVLDLQCQTPLNVSQSGPQVYRLRVDFIDPYARQAGGASQAVAADKPYPIALVTD